MNQSCQSINLSATRDTLQQVKSKFVQYTRRQNAALKIRAASQTQPDQDKSQELPQLSNTVIVDGRRVMSIRSSTSSNKRDVEAGRNVRSSINAVIEEFPTLKSLTKRPISRSTYLQPSMDELTHPKDTSVHLSSSKSQSPNKSVSVLRSKIKTLTILNRHLKSHRQHEMIAYFRSQFGELLAAIQKKELQPVMDLAIKLLEKAIELNQIYFFSQVTNFIGLFCRDLGEWDKAVFFFGQFKVVADSATLLNEKCQALINMATVGTKIQLFELSIRLLKKALQYAWKVGNLEQELQIYELIGVNYYYLGDITEARFYHNKSVRCDNEIESSPLRTISIAIIDRQMRTSDVSRFTEFNRLFLFRLSLPIANHIDGGQCDAFKNTKYTNAKAEPLLRSVIEEPEFVSFELEQPVYSRLRDLKHQKPTTFNIDQEIDFSFLEDEKPHKSRIIARNPKFQSVFGSEDEVNQSRKRMPISIEANPHSFKVPIERQIASRLTTKLEVRMMQIHARVANNINRGGVPQRQKVHINHLTEHKLAKTKTSSTDPRVLARRYTQYFEQVMSNMEQQHQ